MDSGHYEAFDILLNAGTFFYTYGEYCEDLGEFHQHFPAFLNSRGICSFFNGLCGGDAFFHVVYCQLVSLELESLGYSTELIPLPVKNCLGGCEAQILATEYLLTPSLSGYRGLIEFLMMVDHTI